MGDRIQAVTRFLVGILIVAILWANFVLPQLEILSVLKDIRAQLAAPAKTAEMPMPKK